MKRFRDKVSRSVLLRTIIIAMLAVGVFFLTEGIKTFLLIVVVLAAERLLDVPSDRQ